MTGLEQKLHDALTAGAEATRPAPDLFARVRLSVEEDRRRRRRVRRWIAVAASASVGVGVVVVALSDLTDGRLVMRWWMLELITTVVLIGLALWLGPFIKRFGRSYAADVFRVNPRTGKSYIVLTDIVYYLIFVAYIFFTVRFDREPGWAPGVSAAQLQYEVARVGGILLIIGVLHGLNLLILPVLGRLFSLNRRLDERIDPEE